MKSSSTHEFRVWHTRFTTSFNSVCQRPVGTLTSSWKMIQSHRSFSWIYRESSIRILGNVTLSWSTPALEIRPLNSSFSLPISNFTTFTSSITSNFRRLLYIPSYLFNPLDSCSKTRVDLLATSFSAESRTKRRSLKELVHREEKVTANEDNK